MSVKPWLSALAVAIVAAATISSFTLRTLSAAPSAAVSQTPQYLNNFPNFNPSLSTQLPGDVDVALKKKLISTKEFPRVQRLFDLWSWQAFLSLNWPMNNQGQFAPSISDTTFGPPMWTTWHESTNIFREDGGVPSACQMQNAQLSLTRDTNLAVARDLKPFALPSTFDKRRIRLLGNISAVGDRSPVTKAAAKGAAPASLSDIMQAFTAPLIDQNGNYVFYEIQINPDEVNYICKHKLYNIQGQVAFTGGNPHTKADLPSGIDSRDGSGSWELKFAWRVLTRADDRTRYLWSDAIVPPVNGKCPDKTTPTHDECQVQVGLVGMHIGHKSASSPQWIWSTFEQVDNLSMDNVAHPGLKPSFFDPDCPACVPNQAPSQDNNGNWATTPPTQVARAAPIPADKIALNGAAEASLENAGTALRYYQLIDSQWPTDPTAPPTKPEAGLPGAIENKPGGNPTPVFLTNVTMETYFQVGVQPACHQEEGVSCPPAKWLTENQAHGQVSDTTAVFATESCMGCHSSAGLYTTPTKTSGQLTGDFSWLFSQKAKSDKSSGH
ncbi:hypothetical protein [Dyella silvatica]|uniref:hypothetical protein n=1 Tax=Dyella silvatica TaxID=2992128 RepID=UPI00225B9BE3|nr:hypothetical protein [Dyella silvatica]